LDVAIIFSGFLGLMAIQVSDCALLPGDMLISSKPLSFKILVCSGLCFKISGGT